MPADAQTLRDADGGGGCATVARRVHCVRLRVEGRRRGNFELIRLMRGIFSAGFYLLTGVRGACEWAFVFYWVWRNGRLARSGASLGWEEVVA